MVIEVSVYCQLVVPRQKCDGRVWYWKAACFLAARKQRKQEEPERREQARNRNILFQVTSLGSSYSSQALSLTAHHQWTDETVPHDLTTFQKIIAEHRSLWRTFFCFHFIFLPVGFHLYDSP